MTTYFTDSFTGSNGSSWNATNWASLISTTGASAQIQSNQGRLHAGTNTSYSGKRAQRKAGATIADAEWTTKFTINSATDGAFEIWHRAATGAPDGTGYYVRVEVGTGSVELRKAVSFTYTLLDDVAGFVIAQGTQYNLKFYCVGTTLKVKVWTGTEPGSYDISLTDSSVAAAGYSYVAAIGGGSANYNVDVDDITLTDGAGNVFTYTGTVASSGAVKRIFTKAPFTAAVASSGVLTKLKVAVQLFTGAVASTGAFAKQATKALAATIDIDGASIKQLPRIFTATLASAGAFQKSSVRLFTATIATAGVFAITFLGRVFGRPGRAVVQAVRAAEVKIRIRKG